MEPVRLGGTGDVKVATPEIVELVKLIRPNYEKQLSRVHTEFTPTHYRTQLVSGMNYFIKIRTGPNEYVHLRVYKPFDGDAVIHGVRTGLKESDKLEYFSQNSN